MARLRGRIERAAALHRHTAALVAAAAPMLDAYAPAAAPVEQYAEQQDLVATMRINAGSLAPGWLGAPLDALAPSTPLGGPLPPTFVRIGQAHPLDDARFPVVVPLLRAGHVAIDADARDNRVAGLLRSLVLRLLASSPPGSVRIRTIDAADVGGTFGRFTGIDTIMPRAVADADGLRVVLDEGERWLTTRSNDGMGPTLLIVIASLPELTEGRDLARIAALAHAGPAGRLHLVAAGWPPPPLTAETTQAPLPHATQIAIRNPHAWVGDPPGATFSGTGIGPSRLNAPVFLDADPPADLIQAVCAQLAGPWASPPAPATEPSRVAWLDYVAAAQRLDTVRREAITVVAEHKAALKTARADLASVLAKLKHHQTHLRQAAREAGGRSVELTPRWQDAQTAQQALSGTPSSIKRGQAPRPEPPPTAGPRGALTQPSGAFPVYSTVQFRTQDPGALDAATTTGWMPTPMSGPQGAPLGVPSGKQVNGPARAPLSALPGRQVAAPVSGPTTRAAHTAGPTSPAPSTARPMSPPPPTSVPGRVSAALRASDAALARSEAALTGADRAAAGTRMWRNVFVYFAFTLLASIVQVPTLMAAIALDAGLAAVPCGLILPAMTFGLAWLTIGALSRGPSDRTPLVGAAISVLALLPLVFGVLVLLG